MGRASSRTSRTSSGASSKKVGSFAKKAIDVAKKGVTLIPGIGAMIRKLKALVRPLLDRVLKMALDKLPPQLRPVAKQLAQRLLGKVASEATEDEDFAAPAVPDVGSIQQQFDLDVATLLFAEETEQEVIVTEAMYEAERTDGAPIAELHDARARFVDELERGVDPQEALENFIPAVMAVLPIARTVIGVIGRQRVVSFLAGFLAKMIGKYVPAEQSKQLSQAIVDTGLRLMSLEAPTETEVQGLAPAALAGTVEDTVRRLCEADEATLEHPATLEVATTIAFQEAAAENFPPQLIVPELHESTAGGTWVSMPMKGRKYYKKYTRVFDVQITPQMAESLRTFGGTTIAAFLKDKLGIAAPVQGARARLPGDLGHVTRADRAAGEGRQRPGDGGQERLDAAASALARARRVSSCSSPSSGVVCRGGSARLAVGSRSASASTTSRSPARGRRRQARRTGPRPRSSGPARRT